jgi:hypothetical protein
MELSPQEFRGQLLIRYARQSPDMPAVCDGYGVPNSVGHALQCKVGGLIIMRHNKVSNVLADIGMKALTPSAACDEPCIHPNSHKLEKSDQKLPENPVQHCKSKSNDED